MYVNKSQEDSWQKLQELLGFYRNVFIPNVVFLLGVFKSEEVYQTSFS